MKKYDILKRLYALLFPVVCILILNGCSKDRGVLKERSMIHLRLGTSYFSGGDTASALKELQEAKKLSPDDPQIYNVIGLTYFKKRNYDKAIENLKMALQLDPKFSDGHNNLGTIYMDLKQWDDAIFEFRQALGNDLYATPERAYCNIGWAYYKQGDIGRAIGNYKRALEIAHNFVLAHYNLGIGYLSVNRVNEAIDAFKLAIKYNPDYVNAHYRLGLIYFKQGKKKEAKEEFDKVVSNSRPGETRDSAQRYLDLLK